MHVISSMTHFGAENQQQRYYLPEQTLFSLVLSLLESWNLDS